MEELILDKAKHLFFNYGLKTVTMEDIARASGVSKKTIYGSFTGKNEILVHVMNKFLVRHENAFHHCKLEAKDAVEEVINTASLLTDTINMVNQHFFYDIERSFPEVWKLVTTFRRGVVIPCR